MLRAPSFDCVYRWRLEQEQKLAINAAAEAPGRIMDTPQLSRFIQYYQRLTDHCLAGLPAQVHHLYTLDEQRQVTAYSRPRKLMTKSPGS
jgi:D-glycerate 3-kinase